MENTMIPVAAKVFVLINGTQVGALQSYREKTVRQLSRLHPIGSNRDDALHITDTEHVVTLRFLMPGGSALTEKASDPHEQFDFTLQINAPDRMITYSGCEYQSIEMSSAVGQGIVCEAVIHALARSSSDW